MRVPEFCIILIFNVYYTTGQSHEAHNTTIANATNTSLIASETTISIESHNKSSNITVVNNKVKPVLVDLTKTNSSNRYEVMCKLQPNLNNCKGGGFIKRHYYDYVHEDCKEADMGAKCNMDDNMFILRKECREHCLIRGPLNIATFEPLPLNATCRLQPDFGKCDGYFPKFYYDLNERRCKGFSYSGCGGNKNRFESNYGCTSICSPLFSDMM